MPEQIAALDMEVVERLRMGRRNINQTSGYSDEKREMVVLLN